MNAPDLENSTTATRARRFPLTGVALVFRRRLRRRRLIWDLLGALGLLGLLLAIAAGLQSLFFGMVSVYSNNEIRFLLRWLTTETVAAALLLPCAGAILGSGAVPVSSKREVIQGLLLTSLTAWDIVVGRLLAALWTPFCVLCVSLITWLIAQAKYHFLPDNIGGARGLLAAHLVLLAMLLMSGSVGFLFALRIRPGRSWERGALLSVSLSAVCLFGLFALNGPIRRMNDPTRLIEAALIINPISGVCAALDKDILRVPWIYNRTQAPEYPFYYPVPLATTSVLLTIMLGALTTATLVFRRAYHTES